MAARIITSIGAALEVLEKRRNYRWMTPLDRMIAIMVHKLRCLRTFLLCLTVLKGTGSRMQMVLRRHLLCSSDNAGTSLGPLLVRIEGVVSKISDDRVSIYSHYMSKLRKYLVYIESFEGEMDKWYTSLSGEVKQSSSSAVPDQVWDVANSVIENLDDFLIVHGDYIGVLVEPMETLKENIKFFRNFIQFATLLCADQNQEFHDLLSLIQPLLLGAAQLTAHLFSSAHYNTEAYFRDVTDSERELSYEGMKSMISAFLLEIKPAEDLLMYESYAKTLESITNSRELCVSKLHLKDFITFLLSTLWEMLQLDSAPVVSFKFKLQTLYEGLRFLNIGKTRDITRTAAFDAGIVIFSLHRKDYAIDDGLRDFLENIQAVRTEVLEVHAEKTLKYNVPETTVLGHLDFLFDYLTEVRSSKFDLDTQSYASKIREHLVLLKSFMWQLVELRNQQEYLHQAVWSLAVEVTYKMELLINHLVLGNVLDSFPVSFQSIADDMVIIKADFMNIFDKCTQEIRVQKATWTSTRQWPSRSSTPKAEEVVGFETEGKSIINRLRGESKRLQVVAIVGMPGLGKTTLAKMIYNDSKVGYHFHIRVWCSVSQVFNRRKVLLQLLKQIKPDGDFDTDTDDLSQQLWRSLKGRRYLVYIDDIWEVQAFDCLKESFPDDSTGSRFLLTSRNGEIASDKPCSLRQLTESESLGLLQKKLFAGNDWPSSLLSFGLEVAQYCKGLPLTILIVSGILTTTRQEDWKGVLESLRSGITTTLTDECINSIELSYKHLPHHLKPCFLSLGAFPEDHSVSVKNLIWQWIAEGFVRKTDSESLEQVATDYLNILIDRSLVMKAGETSEGGVKECRIHDLLHDFCSRKANEELFFHVLKKEPLPFYELGKLRRLCIHSGAEDFKDSKLFLPHLRSVVFFNAMDKNKGIDMSFIFRISKLLRVLSMDQVGLAHLPSEIGFLVQLRYLAIQVDESVSPSIGNLTNLETLFLFPKNVRTKLPDTFWNLRKLRHLYTSSQPGVSAIELPANNLDSYCNLFELDSLSTLYSGNLDIMEKQLRKFPNIRRLKCRISDDPLKVMSFSFLSQLESLSLTKARLDSNELILPESIKKLTFLNCDLPVSFFSRITQQLPNLEVLKTRRCSFTGNEWHVEEGQFVKLKILELVGMNIVKWTADCYDQFPNLEKLVLIGCDKLVEIPECLENVATLKMIDVVRWQPGRVASLVKKVEECQKDWGTLVQVCVRNIGMDVFEDVEVSDKEDDVSEEVEVSDKEDRETWHGCF